MKNTTKIMKTKAQERAEYEEYVNTPGKLSISAFRPKLNFNLNRRLSGFNLRYLNNPNDYIIDFDVFLASKGKNLQRGFIWTELQKQELIISVLKGVKIPPITAIQYRESNRLGRKCILKIIDGKQRLSTLLSFYRNEFAIEFEGKNYFFNDLSNQAKSEIDDCLRFDIGYEYDDEQISDDEKIAWFEMINFVGTPQDKQHLENLKS